MGSIGSWMSPSVRMTAACATGRQLATWLSCARSPSTSSVTAEQPRSACGRVASRLPGMTSTCCLYWLDDFMRRPRVAPPHGPGRWNVTTVRRILTNPVCTGAVYAGRVQEAHGTGATATPRRLRPRTDWITVASIPALVSQEQFDRVQDKLAQNRQFARRNK